MTAAKGAVAMLPAGAGEKAPAMRWVSRARQLGPPKSKLSAPELKKAVSAMEKLGKSVAAIEALPGGAFRVLLHQSDAPPEVNPFDEVLE